MAGANIINNASKLGIGSFPTSSQPPTPDNHRPWPITHHPAQPVNCEYNPRSALEFGAKAPESWQHKISSVGGVGGFTTFACPPTPGLFVGLVSSFLAAPPARAPRWEFSTPRSSVLGPRHRPRPRPLRLAAATFANGNNFNFSAALSHPRTYVCLGGDPSPDPNPNPLPDPDPDPPLDPPPKLSSSKLPIWCSGAKKK